MRAADAAVVAGLVAALGLVAVHQQARAGIRDFDDGWGAGPAASADLLDGVAHNGAGNVGFWAACGVSRLHGLAELPLQRLAAGRRAAGWSAALSWQRLGGNLWREDQVDLQASLAVAPGARRPARGPGAIAAGPWCGLAVRWRRPSYATVAGPDVLEIAPVAGYARGGIVGTLQVLPLILRHGPQDAGPRPWLSARWHDGVWSAACEFRRADHGAVAWRASGDLRLGAVFSWGLVADGGSGAAGVTTAWRRGRLLVRTSHLVHPVLGATHRWDLAAIPLGAS